MRRSRRPHTTPRNRFIACSLCFQGLQLVEVVRDGRREREGRRCQCLRQWLAEQKALAAAPLERPRADLA